MTTKSDKEEDKKKPEPAAKEAEVSPVPELDKYHGVGGAYELDEDGKRKKAKE